MGEVTRAMRAVVLLAAMAASACTMSVSPPAASPSTPTSPSAAPAASTAFPVGVFAIRRAVIDFKPDGSYRIFDAGSVYVVGRYTLQGGRITMVDVGGQYACKPDGTPGVYAWSQADAALTLTLVSDACEARRSAMAESPFKATQAPN